MENIQDIYLSIYIHIYIYVEYIRNIEGRVGRVEGPHPPIRPSIFLTYSIYIIINFVPYIFPCVSLNLWSQQKTSPLISGGFRPHLELLGHDGHVHPPSFGPISHVSGPKLTF